MIKGLGQFLQRTRTHQGLCYKHFLPSQNQIRAMVLNALGIMTIHSKVNSFAALAGASLIAFGFGPIPFTDTVLPRATWYEYCVSVLPILPLLIVTLCLLSHRHIPAILAIVLALLVAVIGGLITLVLLALSGAGTEMVTLHGTALTVTISSCIVLASTCGRIVKIIASGLFLLTVCAGLWSLAMAPFAYAKASEIASERSFCIAAHSPVERELTSLLGLRGFSFYTTLSGYKLGDAWYFHGLLLVDDGDDLEVYNWSPRSMSFNRLDEPRLMIASPFKACQPRDDFLKNLPVI